MNDTTEQTQPTPTRLILFSSDADRGQFIINHLSNLTYLVQALNYKFSFEMPTVHCKIAKREPIVKKYVNWFGKIREKSYLPSRGPTDYCHYLQFSAELSPEELAFWQVFKLGYLSRDLDPNGIWKKNL